MDGTERSPARGVTCVCTTGTPTPGSLSVAAAKAVTSQAGSKIHSDGRTEPSPSPVPRCVRVSGLMFKSGLCSSYPWGLSDEKTGPRDGCSFPRRAGRTGRRAPRSHDCRAPLAPRQASAHEDRPDPTRV